ncbi:MAG: FAD-binding oxidoreductase [Alphaproteobacteria bacterium]|nr:FAD-binding oxidoreductase [Alphaproteobacteria bacterium]
MDLLTANDQPGAYPDSYYAASVKPMEAFAPLHEDMACDVCVIGAGYTGLSAALYLAGQGFDVIVLEAHRVGWGASGRNGGQLGSGQRLDQTDLEHQFGEKTAHQLWELGREAKSLVRDLIARHNMNCDYKPGILYADHRKRLVAGSQAYVEKLQRDYGYGQVRFLDQKELRETVATKAYFGGALDTGAGHLHPLKFAQGLASAAVQAGARIYEQTRVQKVEPSGTSRVVCERAAVSAPHVLLACNGYLGDLERSVSRHVMPLNNYIIATEPLAADRAQALIRKNIAVADSRNVVNYFRLSRDNRLLFGGGESYGYKFPKDIKTFIRPHMLSVFPQLSDVAIDYGWGGTLGITMNRMPHLRRLEQGILTASGYSGHGVGMATLCGKLAGELICGTAARFDIMASIPTPEFPGGPRWRQPLLALGMWYYALRDRF